MSNEVEKQLKKLNQKLISGFLGVIIAVVFTVVMQFVVFPFGIKAIAGVFGYEFGYWASLGIFVFVRLLLTPFSIINQALQRVTKEIEAARKYINKEIV